MEEPLNAFQSKIIDDSIIDNYFSCSNCSLMLTRSPLFFESAKLCVDNQWKEKDHISYLVQHYCNPANSVHSTNKDILELNKANLTEVISLLPTRESYVKFFNFLSQPYRDEIENGDFYKVKRKIFTDIYNPEMSKYRKKQLTEKHYPLIKQPITNMRCNKILKIKDSVPDGNFESYSENIITNTWRIEDTNYIVPYNTLFYQSNHISPVFFGRSKVKGKYSHINTIYNSTMIHPSFSGYMFPPLNQRPCVCSTINKKYDSLNIEMDGANRLKNDLEIRNNEIHGIVGDYCYDNFHKPILSFDKLKPDTSLLKYIPDENTTPKATVENDTPNSFSNKDKEILTKTLSLFQTRVLEIRKEEDLTIQKPNYTYTNYEPLDLYELIHIDNTNNKNIFKNYTSIFKQMMLQPDDYNSIKHLNTTDITKLLDNKEIEKRIKEYSCPRCKLSNLNFHEYVEHVCYRCKYNIYPCKLMATCVYNFCSHELFNNHIRNCHRSRNYDNNNSNSNNIDIIPLYNVEIEIKRNEQWIKGIVKSFSNITCLHEVEINGVIENISLTDQEFRYIELKNELLSNDYDNYRKLVYDQNFRLLDKYLDSHRIEINSNIHVLINQQLFGAKLIGLKPENRTFQVVLNGSDEVIEITLGHIFHPSEYRRPNRKGTLLFNVDDSNLPIENNNHNNHNNNNSPSSTANSSSISDRNSESSNSRSENDNNSEDPKDIGALSILNGNWEFSDSSNSEDNDNISNDNDEPHNSESGSSDEAPSQPIYDVSEFLKGKDDDDDDIAKQHRSRRGGARRGAGRRKIAEIVKMEEHVRRGRGRGRGRGSRLWRGNSKH